MNLRQHKPGTIVAAPEHDAFISNVVAHQTELNHIEMMAKAFIGIMTQPSLYKISGDSPDDTNIKAAILMPASEETFQQCATALHHLQSALNKFETQCEKNGSPHFHVKLSLHPTNRPNHYMFYASFPSECSMKAVPHITSYIKSASHSLQTTLRQSIFSTSGRSVQ